MRSALFDKSVVVRGAVSSIGAAILCAALTFGLLSCLVAAQINPESVAPITTATLSIALFLPPVIGGSVAALYSRHSWFESVLVTAVVVLVVAVATILAAHSRFDFGENDLIGYLSVLSPLLSFSVLVGGVLARGLRVLVRKSAA